MKKKLLVLLTLLCCLTGFSQGVVVGNTTYNNSNANVLVNTLLGTDGRGCLVRPANVSVTTGAQNYAYSQGTGLGTFTNSNTAFPMTSGVVMVSGNALTASGPNTSVSTDGAAGSIWLGDADLEAALGGGVRTRNAAVLEFDFTAVSTSISIPYMFASEEYGQYQCTSRDGMAILIKPVGSPSSSYINIATRPNGSPISVATIRSKSYNSTCASVNDQYFGVFNGGGAAMTAATNFEGQTVQLTANYSGLVVGNTYHIKIVVADDGDANATLQDGTDGRYNSAVFFPAGGVNLGQTVLMNSLTTASNNALCQGESYTINTGLSNAYNYAWTTTTNSAVLGTSSSLTVNQSATYVVTVTDPATSCSTSQQIEVQFATPPSVGTPANIYSCPNSSGVFTYNLNANNSVLLSQSTNTNVTYHGSAADAQTGANPLNTTYTTSNNATITVYARVKSTQGSCYTVAPFDLVPVAAPTASVAPGLVSCETSVGSNFSVFNLTANTATILGSQSPSNYSVSYYTSQADADSALNEITTPNSFSFDGNAFGADTRTIYARVSSSFNTSCYAVTSFTIRISPIPPVSTLSDIQVCGFYDLPTITDGTFWTAAGGATGTGTQIAANARITTSQTIYIYNSNADGCFNQSQFTVTVLTAVTPPSNVAVCDQYILPALPSGHKYMTGPNGAGPEIAPGTAITATQTIYYFIPTAASCTANTNFVVTVYKADTLPNQSLCNGLTYTLPALSAGNSYYTASGGPTGGGNLVLAGTVINNSRNLWIYRASPDGSCYSESQFSVYVTPTLAPVSDVTACGSYQLPALSLGAYFTSPGGVGPSGYTINSTRTIYVYYRDAVSNCVQERSFIVNITQRPAIGNYPNVVACNSYTLPVDNTIIGYYTQPNMSGTFYASNTTHTLTETTTLYATTASTSSGCYNQKQFTVTVINSNVVIPDVTRCTQYCLPAIPFGRYYNNPGGPTAAGNGTPIPVGQCLTTSQRVYVWQEFTQGGVTCTGSGDFLVTILTPPTVSTPSNVVACGSYTLPALPAGQAYYTDTNGQGTQIAANTAITTSQTIYVFASSNTTPVCTSESSFTVSIVDSTVIPTNVNSCGNYTLPALTVGGYFTSPNGVGPIAAGTVINANRRIYYYAPVTNGTNCTTNTFFDVSISTQPTITDYPDVTACNSYTLPALPTGQSYYTQPNGQGAIIPAGTPITGTTDVYPYSGTAGCEAYDQITITITPLTLTQMPNQSVCENLGYVLPSTESINNAIVGYYTMSGGPSTAGNQALLPGAVLTTTQRVYVYAYLTNTPSCFVENFFDVTAVPSPAIDITSIDPDGDGIIAVCGTYQLPAYPTVTPAPASIGYFTQPDGGGTQLFPTQTISTSMPVYIFVRSGGTPDCAGQAQLQIFVNPNPPADVFRCDSYVLPALPAGQQYRTAASGGGTVIAAGTTITATQQIYFYIPAAAACTSNTFFTVNIYNTPQVGTIANVVTCDEYILPALTVGNYYSGPDRTGTAYRAGDRITSTMDMYVYAESATAPNCVAQTSFNINITTTPNTIAFSDVDVCDSYTLPSIPAGYHYYTVAGGPSAAGQSEVAPGTQLFTNASASGSRFYIYSAATANPACFTESTFNVSIYSASVDALMVQLANDANALPTAWGETYVSSGNADPTLNNLLSVNIEACDSYTLPNLNIGGTNPNDTYIQHYYALPGGPDTPGQQIVTDLVMSTAHSLYNASTGTIKLYLYRVLNGRLVCNDQSIITVKVNTTPVLSTAPANVTQCFTYTLPALPAPFAYYSQTGGRGLITNLTLTDTQNVYAYAQVGTNQICSTEYPFSVTVNKIDIPRPADVVSCEQYVLPQANPSTARYFQLPGGPNVGGQVEYPVNYVFTTGTYQVYLWDHTSTTPDCTDEEQFQIRVIARPTPIIPNPVETCSVDDAGLHGYFDLTAAIAEAIGGQTDVAAYVYETQAGADFDVNRITNITNYYNLNANQQQLFIRLYSTAIPNDTSCGTVVPVRLIVHPRPIAVDPLTPYNVCDNGASDTDGIGVFDLTTYIPQVLGSLNPATHTVSFYQSMTDLQNGGPVIATPATYNTVTGTVYIKVTINATGCYDVVPLQLNVNPKPVVVQPSPLSLCDVNNPGDEIELFDLTSKIGEITTGVLGLNTTFHTTLTDAEAGTNAIGNPTAFQNTPGVQSIFVRVTNDVTGCYRVVLLDIRVEPLPVLTPLTPIQRTVCSTNDDGYGVFDLDQMATTMINGSPNITVTFYPTLVSAQFEINPIVNTAAYQNVNPLVDTVYAVPTNTITGCKGIPVVITLLVNPAPQSVLLTDITKCDDTDLDGQDDTVVFDLTTQDASINTQLGLPAGSVTIQYFTSEANAQSGSPRIVSPATYSGHNNDVIWVRIEYPGTECFIVTSFKLIIREPQKLAHPANLIICDDTTANDGKAPFDLTVREDEILTPFGIGESNVVKYYETAADRDADTNAIADPTQYTNTANPQNIYVRVTTPLGCVSKESMLIMVTPLPVPNPNPQPLVRCDDNNRGEGIENFNLTLAAADVLAGDSLSTVQYYASAADLAAGTPIATPTAYANVVPWDDTVIVSLTRTNTQPGAPACEQHVTLNLHVNPLPPIFDASGNIRFYAICNPMSTGYEQFNLIGHINDQLTANGVNPTDYYIRFYADQAAETAGTALPHIYTNQTQYADDIWVVVRNNATGCTIKGTLWLYAEQSAVANPVTTNPLPTCDYDAVNDGVTDIDLTRVAPEVLGSQNPTQFILEYYTSMAAAVAGDTTAPEFIATPTAYNAGPSGTVWVRVVNSATNAKCFDVTSFGYVVNVLPEPIVTSGTGDTVCKDLRSGATDGVELWSGVVNAGHSYQWYVGGVAIPGATSEYYTATDAGLYSVVVTSPEGCVSLPSDAFEVFLSGPATPVSGAGYVVSNAFSAEQTLTVLVEGYGEYQYAIAPEGEPAVGPWQNSNVFENIPLGYYTIYVRDVKTDFPCATFPINGVSLVDFPKFFTPNGDGYNDYWNIVGMANANYADARIMIYDRYGKLIKQLSPMSRADEGQGWDGTYNGHPLPSDDYWFTVEFTENNVKREFRGHFALKR